MITQDEALSMIVFWWRYQWAHDLGGLGFPKECPSTKGWRASRQHDSENGCFDTDARGELAQRIGNIVDGMPEPYRTALHVLARNKATGVQVWHSPKLPADEIQRGLVVARAVEMLQEAV